MASTCCLNPANHVIKPHPNRPGWERVTCKVCKKWVGDRDPKRKENQK